jgi:hypothetical protein
MNEWVKQESCIVLTDISTLLCHCLQKIRVLQITVNYAIKRRDSSVGIATCYGLDGPGIESRWGRYFPHPSRPDLGTTQSPVSSPICFSSDFLENKLECVQTALQLVLFRPPFDLVQTFLKMCLCSICAKRSWFAIYVQGILPYILAFGILSIGNQLPCVYTYRALFEMTQNT